MVKKPKSPGPPGKRSVGPLDKAVGQRLRQLRMQVGLSQEALATAIGVSFQQIQKYEKGINRIPLARLTALAKKLETTVADLLGLNATTPGPAPTNTYDPELYKLVMQFQKLPERLRAPIRSLIVKLSEPDAE